MKQILLLDNYDSFTYNLYHYLKIAGSQVEVIRNDDPLISQKISNYKNVVISPGPSTPRNAGALIDFLPQYIHHLTVLGVCLGMQILNEILGGSTIHADKPIHGKTSCIQINNQNPLFSHIPETINVARYHSLICGKIPNSINVIAGTPDLPMAFQYKQLPVWGVQFHPESFLTEFGLQIIQNFVNLCH